MKVVPHRGFSEFSVFSPVIYQLYNCWPCLSDVFQTLIGAPQVHVLGKLHGTSVGSVLLERHGRKGYMADMADRIPMGETRRNYWEPHTLFTESAHLLLMNINSFNMFQWKQKHEVWPNKHSSTEISPNSWTWLLWISSPTTKSRSGAWVFGSGVSTESESTQCRAHNFPEPKL